MRETKVNIEHCCFSRAYAIILPLFWLIQCWDFIISKWHLFPHDFLNFETPFEFCCVILSIFETLKCPQEVLLPYTDVTSDMNMSNIFEPIGYVGSHTKWTCPFPKIIHHYRLHCSLHNQWLWCPLCSHQYLPKKTIRLDHFLYVEVLYIKAYGVRWQPFPTGHFGVNVSISRNQNEWAFCSTWRYYVA